MKTAQERTQWVFEHGDCEGCMYLRSDEETRTDPASASCQVLDYGCRYSDKCPRTDQYDAALAAAVVAAPVDEILSDGYERFLPLLSEIVREKKLDAAFEIMSEFDRARREYAEATL